MNRLDHALALARQGLLIFPLRPRSKEPFHKDDFGGKGWVEYMTSDEAVIREWFTTLPDMNYGVCGGKFFFILDPDVDTKRSKDGLAIFEDMQSVEDPSDMVYGATFEVKSPRGGRHLYLRTAIPVSNSAGTFAEGVDVRGTNGYVVGPGSFTDRNDAKGVAEGEYVVTNDTEILDAPQWVMQRLTDSLARSVDADNSTIEWDLPEQLEKGRDLIRQQTSWPTEGQQGDAATLHFCHLLRDFSISQDAAFDLLHEPLYPDAQSWNERCDPPWEDGALADKCRNAFKYAKNQPGSKGGLLDTESDYGSDFAEIAEKKQRLERFADLVAQTFTGSSLTLRVINREMVIPQWMPMQGMTQIVARRGVGKSILTLDIALRCATGMKWYAEPIREDMCAVFCCGEDDTGLQEQMKAWMSVHKIQPTTDRFIAITKVPNLMDAEDVRSWAEYIVTVLPEGRRCVFFIDTWQRATSRASQNDEEQMQLATDNAEGLQRHLNSALVANFHPPKHNEGTISGSQIVENKGGALWRMTKASDGYIRKLVVDRIKGKGEGNEKQFEWKEVTWGETDEFGLPRTGIVPNCIKEDGKAESEASIQNRRGARYMWASLIAEMITNHDRVVPLSALDFSIADVARRTVKYLDAQVNAHWRPKFQAAHDFSWTQGEKTISRRLSEMFTDNDPPQETETREYVQLVRVNRTRANFKIVPAPKAGSAGFSGGDDPLDI